MKPIFTILFIVFAHTTFSQNNTCRTDLLNNLIIDSHNVMTDNIKYDFSDVWLHTDDKFIYGIIGENHQRILMKFLTVAKNSNNPHEYFVYGKSNVKGNICEFIGHIKITKIQKITSENYGADDQYKNSKIQSQFLITADYEFYEMVNKFHSHSGYFSGFAQSLVYIDSNNSAKYNDISIHSDAYYNNAFVGHWNNYNSDFRLKCNWGDYRVPYSHCDFDMGAGEFSVSEKYLNKGWLNTPAKSQNESNQKKWWE